MRRLFKAQLRCRKNPIILNYENKLKDFTFIQTQININPNQDSNINTKNLTSKISDSTKIYKNPHKFIQIYQKNKDNLLNVQEYDFTLEDLKRVQVQNFKKVPDKLAKFSVEYKWAQNQQILHEISLHYNSYQTSLYQNLSKQNLKTTLQSLTHFNCMDLKIWQRIISFVSTYYKQLSLEERLISITAISEYLKKFQFSHQINNTNAFKFMYPEAYIVDLVQLRNFFKGIQNQHDFIKQSDSQQTQVLKLRLLQNVIYLIMKSTKKADMNVYAVRAYFEKRIDQMIYIASKHETSPLHESIIYNIYFVYSYLNYDNPIFYQKLEKFYYQYFRKKINSSSSQVNNKLLVANKSKQINKLLSIWKLNQRSNMEIYNQIIQPFLKQMVQNSQQIHHYSVIGINLLMSGIKDHELLNQMIKKCDQRRIPEDEFHHMLKHYLNIVAQDLTHYSTFSRCLKYQNLDVLKHMVNNKMNVFSSCLNYPEISGIQQKKKQNIQFHKVEKMWFQVIKKLFQPKYKVLENINICTYEIDFLILTQKIIFAVEIQGGHYSKKKLNRDTSIQSPNQIKSTGKKQLKQTILKAYGIKTIRIHCDQKIPTYFSQSNDQQLGCQYLMTRIKEQIGEELVLQLFGSQNYSKQK